MCFVHIFITPRHTDMETWKNYYSEKYKTKMLIMGVHKYLTHLT